MAPSKASGVGQKMLLAVMEMTRSIIGCVLLRKRDWIVAARVRDVGNRGPLVLLGIHKEGVASVQRSEIVQIAGFLCKDCQHYSRILGFPKLTGFLPLLAMWVLAAADDNRIDSNQNGQNSSQHCLHNHQYKSSNSLGSLGNAKLLHKDQDADHRQHTNHLDNDVDPVSRLEGKWSGPKEQS